jgi:hypothetical protein
MYPCFADERASLLTGDGHEEETLSEVRRADPRSAQIRSPDGVTRSFQVSVNSVEPLEAVRARNLLSKDDWRPALLDELEPRGPDVSLVVEASPVTCLRPRLARAGSGPALEIVRPSCESERIRPDADPGEEVRLAVALEVFRLELDDTAVIDVPWSDAALRGEAPEPLGGVRLVLVVEDGTQDPLALGRHICPLLIRTIVEKPTLNSNARSPSIAPALERRRISLAWTRVRRLPVVPCRR